MRPFVKILPVLLSALILNVIPAHAADAVYKGHDVSYQDGAAELQGYWSPAQCGNAKNAPLVMIAHQWKGLGPNEKTRADMLAAQCYNAFAVDVYGKGIRPATDEAAFKESAIYKNDPALARRRMNAALTFARTQPGVDPKHIAVIGYCFGGAMALELARSGADLAGIVTFHGDLTTKDPVTRPGIIKAPIEVHHGADDPHVTQQAVTAFMAEMKAADADWTLTQYAHAVHAFTQKDAGNDPSKGVAYNARADARSWAALLTFLQEVFKN